MVIDIKVFSVDEFRKKPIKKNILENNEYLIGIHSNGWIHSIPVIKEKHDRVLNLWFEDVEKTGLKAIKWFNNTHRIIYAVRCSREQGKEIVDFVKRIPNNSTLYIYCAKGQSRSPAVANYVRKYINHESVVSPETHNKYLYSLLEEIHNES